MPELRAPVEFDPATAKLVEFRRADWERPGDGRFDAFHRWQAARKEWVAAHPDSNALGSPLVRLRTEVQTQLSLYDPNASPPA
jgi:hypothetical protein